MFGIRKFVGYTGAAAGIGAALALALSSQAGHAAAPVDGSSQASTSTFTPSAACTAAVQAIKAWFVTDRSEDNAERMALQTDSSAAPAAEDDATELAQLRGLFLDARNACLPAVTSTTTAPPTSTTEERTEPTAEATEPTFTKPALSAACTAAIAALKTAWAAGRPTTQAQWQNLMTLAQAVRTTCGFTWSGDR